MAKLNTIGLAVIVRDEETNLPVFLDQIRGIFDQIVFVDTGSVDETLRILKYYKAETECLLFQKNWVNDFSAIRNFSFSNLKTDFIVWLDADDRLTPEAKTFITGLKTANFEDLDDGYLTRYAYFYDGQADPQLILPRLQIVKRNAEPFWLFKVFEHLNLKKDATISESGVTIHHQCFSSQKKVKETRNITILQESLEELGENFHDLYFLGMNYFSQNNFQEAIPVLKRALRIFPEDFLVQLRLLQSLFHSDRHQELVDVFQNFPRHDSVLRGFYLEMKGEVDRALSFYQNSPNFNFGDSGLVNKEEMFFWSVVFPIRRMIGIHQSKNNFEEIKKLKLKLLTLVNP